MRDNADDPGVRSRGEIPDADLERPYYVEGPRVMLWIACPAITRVFVHFTGGRTQECRRTDVKPYCKWCAHRDPRKVQDWLWVLDPAEEDRVPHLCCLTPRATEMGRLSLWDLDGRLDGLAVHVWRLGGKRTGPMCAELLPNDHADYDSCPAPLPELSPAICVLRRMWAARLRRERPGAD